MSSQVLLKIQLISANLFAAERKRTKSQGKLSVRAAVVDAAQKEMGGALQFRTNSAYINSKDIVAWNQVCWFTLPVPGNAVAVRFGLLEDEEEIGVTEYLIKNCRTEDKGPEELDLSRGGRLKVNIVMMDGDGRIHGSAKTLQIRNPYRASTKVIAGDIKPEPSPRTNPSKKISALPTGTGVPGRNPYRASIKTDPTQVNAAHAQQFSATQGVFGKTLAQSKQDAAQKKAEQAPAPQAQAQAPPARAYRKLVMGERGAVGDNFKKVSDLESTVNEIERRITAKAKEISRLKTQLENFRKIEAERIEKEKNVDPEEENLKKQLKQEIDQIIVKLQEHIKKGSDIEFIIKKYEGVDPEVREILNDKLVISETQLDNTNQNAEIKSLTTLKKTKDTWHYIPESPVEFAEFLSENEDLDFLSEVKLKFVECDPVWISDFLEAGGLTSINTLLSIVESKPNPDFPLLIKESQLTTCIRILLNTQSALIIVVRDHSQEFLNFIKLGISSKNSLVKAQIFMLMAGLCIYSDITHKMINNVLKFFAKSPRPYFILIRNLKEERDKGLMTAVMCLINALVAGEAELGSRMRLRSQLISVGLLNVISKLEIQFKDDRGLISQFESFREIQRKDNEKLRDLRFIGNIDLQKSEMLFNRVMLQTSALGLERIMLSILQHMLLIPSQAVAPHVIRRGLAFIERITRRVTFAEEAEVIGSMSPEDLQRELFKHVHHELMKYESSSGNTANHSNTSNTSEKTPQKANPPLPPIPNATPSAPPAAPLPPSRAIMGVQIMPVVTGADKANLKKVTKDWKKFKPDVDKITNDTYHRMKKANNPQAAFLNRSQRSKITFFDSHTASNIGILRSQFRKWTDHEIAASILNIKKKPFTTEQLEALLKCIPTDDSVLSALLAFEGNPNDLREAEKFVFILLTVDNVGDILQSLLFIDEYEVKISTIQHQIATMLEACNEVLNSPKLKQMLGVVLGIGNFLNYGESVGNAKGFYISSLSKLVQFRATNNAMLNLMQFLVQNVEENAKELLDFYTELPHVEEASKYHPKLVKAEIDALNVGIERIVYQIEQTPAEYKTEIYADFFEHVENFLDNSTDFLQLVQEDWENFEPTMNKVLQAFPNNDNTLQSIFGEIYKFSKKFRDILEQKRREQEEYETFSRLGWLGAEEDGQQATPEKKMRKKIGILDQLIEGIIRGEYGLKPGTSQFFYKQITSSGNAQTTAELLRNTALSKKQELDNAFKLDAIDENEQEEERDMGFGKSFAEDFGNLGGEGGEVRMFSGVVKATGPSFTELDDDIDALLAETMNSLSGFTTDQILG